MRTEKELGEALKREEDTITIEGDLVKKVIKIHGTGKPAWGLAIGAIGVAVVSVHRLQQQDLQRLFQEVRQQLF